MADIVQPGIVAELFALDTADAASVSAFLYRLSNPRCELWADIPEASSFGVLRPDYCYFLDLEARERNNRDSGFLTPERLAELFTSIEQEIGSAVAIALWSQLPAIGPFRDREYLSSGDPSVLAALAPADTVTHPARHLECRLVRMAQIELGSIWRRIESRDWPSDNPSAASNVLFEDSKVLYPRARPFLWFSTSYSTRDQIARIEESHEAPGGLGQCYWLTLAMYKDTYAQVVPPPGRYCFYCKRTMPTERTWRDDIRTCGDMACKRRYEADRRWYRNREDEVRPVVVQYLNLRDASNLHPGKARDVWAKLGNQRDARRIRVGR